MISKTVFIVSLLCLPFISIWSISAFTLDDEIDTIRQRVLELIIWPKPENVSYLVERVLNFSATLNSSCYWSDLNYTNGTGSLGNTVEHMYRISNMLRALTVNGSSVKNDPKIMSQVHCALQVWFEHNWKDPNWWFNQIGIPLEAGMQFLMLGDNATESEIANLKNITLQAHWWLPNPYYVGANLVWMIQVQIYRCLATRNITGLEQAFSRMWEDVVISNSSWQGVQSDWAYHFHHKQLLSDVGYLWARFEYFLNGFVQKADQSGSRVDQDRTRRALSNGLFTFSARLPHHREKSKKLRKKTQKTCFFPKNPSRFAHEADQSGPNTDFDRTRCALFNGLFAFLSALFH